MSVRNMSNVTERYQYALCTTHFNCTWGFKIKTEPSNGYGAMPYVVSYNMARKVSRKFVAL
jgi:hypothetical protein